jgi:hypothetical protein
VEVLAQQLEDRIARTKKKRRPYFLKGLYKELFADCKDKYFLKNSFLVASVYQQEEFIGFYCDLLSQYGLLDIRKAVEKRYGATVRADVRWLEGDTVYKETYFARLNYKKLLGDLQPSQKVDYLEITIGERIFAGSSIEDFCERESSSLLVREELSLLPAKFSKIGMKSQYSKLISFNDHNKLSMIKQYLREVKGLDLNRFHLHQEALHLSFDTAFIDMVTNYHLNNNSQKLNLIK